MATIVLNRPPHVPQLWDDSCWAAVLESWEISSRPINIKLPASQAGEEPGQEAMAAAWGEGPTKGLTPAAKIPVIAAACGLDSGNNKAYEGNKLKQYLADHLNKGYVFCAYKVPGGFHAVLIYKCDEQGCCYMDPNTGHPDAPSHQNCGFWWCNWQWFINRGPLILMRKK